MVKTAPMWAAVLAFLQAVTGAAGLAQLVPGKVALGLVVITAGLQAATNAYQGQLVGHALDVAVPLRRQSLTVPPAPAGAVPPSTGVQRAQDL
jgi:hypothetical protein